jgi:hypothetical protein
MALIHEKAWVCADVKADHNVGAALRLLAPTHLARRLDAAKNTCQSSRNVIKPCSASAKPQRLQTIVRKRNNNLVERLARQMVSSSSAPLSMLQLEPFATHKFFSQ